LFQFPLPFQSAFLRLSLSLLLSLSTPLSHHRLSGGAVTPFSLLGDLVLVSLVSKNADHVLQATQEVQVGQTVSEPLQCQVLLISHAFKNAISRKPAPNKNHAYVPHIYQPAFIGKIYSLGFNDLIDGVSAGLYF
jgi:hypothetical protein